MRRTPDPALSPRMYKHFAIVTVALTAAMALFANGQSEQAAAAGAAGHRAVESKPVKVPQPTFRRASSNTGSWGSDNSAGFGNPTMATPSSGSAGLPPPLAGISGVVQPADGDEAGADDRDAPALLPAAAPPTSDDIAAAIAASRLRSEAGGGGDE